MDASPESCAVGSHSLATRKSSLPLLLTSPTSEYTSVVHWVASLRDDESGYCLGVDIEDVDELHSQNALSQAGHFCCDIDGRKLLPAHFVQVFKMPLIDIERRKLLIAVAASALHSDKTALTSHSIPCLASTTLTNERVTILQDDDRKERSQRSLPIPLSRYLCF